MKPSAVESFLSSDFFSPLDRHFAGLIRRLNGSNQLTVTLGAALVSRRLSDGHPCLSLDEVGGETLPLSSEAQAACPAPEEWRSQLLDSPVVGRPDKARPLVLDESGRLYLHRYWTFEQSVAKQILARLHVAGPESGVPVLDFDALHSSLDRLFPSSASGQKVAAFMAARQSFCVITGGPGTGKTWTVARLLALLLEQPSAVGLRVRLAAPTGKAVARLQESLAAALAGLDCPEAVKSRLQAKDLTSTLHRMLGTIPNSVKFRHHAENPLPVDVLVVDEASMVSLPLMARLLEALPSGARLILVGDKDQLPPIEPGSVLGDICQAAELNGFSEGFRADFARCGGGDLPSSERRPPARPVQVDGVEGSSQAGGRRSGDLLDCVAQLRTNFRSGETAAIQAASTAVNDGDAGRTCELLREFSSTGAAVNWEPLPAPASLKEALRAAVRSQYGPVLESASPVDALRELERFTILCGVREGPFGTGAVNRLVEEILGEEGFATPEEIASGSYAGKPLMVTANHYLLKLYNGDIGVICRSEPSATRGGKGAMVAFPEETGGLREIARERLPEHETAFALTIHKSQGSEYDNVLLVMPDAASPVLTRALLYTGLTRARKSVQLLASEASLRTAIESPSPRRSGLSDALVAGMAGKA